MIIINVKNKKETIEATTNIRYCYIEGPTGPRGEPEPMEPQEKNGPTIINIGLTETTEAGTEAVIQNVSNSVLAGLKENDNITINIKSENNVILTASNSTSDNLEVLKIP